MRPCQSSFRSTLWLFFEGLCGCLMLFGCSVSKLMVQKHWPMVLITHYFFVRAVCNLWHTDTKQGFWNYRWFILASCWSVYKADAPVSPHSGQHTRTHPTAVWQRYIHVYTVSVCGRLCMCVCLCRYIYMLYLTVVVLHVYVCESMHARMCLSA